MYGHPAMVDQHARALSQLDFFGFDGVRDVAVLFARSDSIYKRVAGADVFDLERDARTYHGPLPVVAHPPCRAWGRLRHFAKPRPDEKALGLFAVHQVRTWGGVLEHPESSTLWVAAGLPRPGCGVDEFGGWTLPVSQKWWGHRAEKRTWLYIVGVPSRRVPTMPFVLGEAPCTVGLYSGRNRSNARPEISKAEREATPEAFALWLLDLARRVGGLSPSQRVQVKSAVESQFETVGTKK